MAKVRQAVSYYEDAKTVTMPNGLVLEVGKEYMYFENFAKILSIRTCGGGHGEAVVEGRFGERTTCELEELYAKPVYRKEKK